MTPSSEHPTEPTVSETGAPASQEIASLLERTRGRGLLLLLLVLPFVIVVFKLLQQQAKSRSETPTPQDPGVLSATPASPEPSQPGPV